MVTHGLSGTPRFRLQIRERMSQFPADPLDLDLRNFIRDSSGYRRIERVADLYQPIWFLDYMCRYNGLEPPNDWVTAMNLTDEDVALVPTDTGVRLLVGGENKSGYPLAISEHGSIVSLTTSADRGESHKLAMEAIGLAQECDVLFNRAEILQDRLRAHTEFGKEKEWDYAPDD